MKNNQEQVRQLSFDEIIDSVKTLRNDNIKDFLNEKFLDSFFEEKYKKPLSKVKAVFLRKELRELLISPVDLVHYASVINEMRQSSPPVTIFKNNRAFYEELEKIFRKYCY